MPANRVFLDWRRPALPAAVDYLREKYASAAMAAKSVAAQSRAAKPSGQKRLSFEPELPGSSSRPDATWDLSRVIVVVPGRRAGRRLLELLAFEARDRGLRFLPPTIATEGKLPELLYRPKKPFADTLTQDLAWSNALRQLPPELLAAVVPHPPPRDDETAWLQLGGMLRVRHTELAADTLMFDDVVKAGRDLPRFPDTKRWQAMQAAQDIYLRTLDGLELWDIQTARLFAIKYNEVETDRDIVLLGTVDLNRTMRKFLDLVPERVTALIAAPKSMADRFDAHGCVLPEAWKQVPLPIQDSQVRRVDGAADQADAVAQILASYEGKYRGDQITVGVPDERLVPHVQRQLEQCHVPVRWVIGQLLSETSPYRLLKGIEELLRRETTEAFASLVRHPDVFARLTTAPPEVRVEITLLDELDRLISDYLVTRLDPARWPHEVRRKLQEGRGFTNVARAVEQVQLLIAPLRSKPQRQSSWSAPILSVLEVIYADRDDDPDTLAAVEGIRDCLQLQTLLPEKLAPRLCAADAIAWTLSQLQSEAIHPAASAEAVELLGWLELPLDDAPALILTTFNEGYVPSAVGADGFLPDTFRKRLGLMDCDRSYARDAYAVSALLASRETVHLISARRDAEENPLAPSRLLFAAEPERVVSRAVRFFETLQETPPRAPLVGAGTPAPARSQLYVPRPDGIAVPLRLRVTQFRDYLACPYRFFLKHLLNLRSSADTCDELPANAFGDLIHKVLERFGADPAVRLSTREDDIFDYLAEQLRQCVALRYGDGDRLAAVEIQVEQIRTRLRRFARWQAERTNQGWQIVYSETTADEDGKTAPPPDATIEVDGVPLLLGGRIDRIDRHESLGTITIFDYKTSDLGDKPDRTHRRQKQWVDLQLPLYRYLAEAWGYQGTMRLGYILIPKSLDDIGEAIAPWSEADLASADEAMRGVVRSIRNGEFWPPAEPPDYEDDFTVLCQDRRLGGRALAEPGEALL